MIRTVRYEEVKCSGKANGVCPVCGKKVTRTKTFTHTINPFNKNEEGNIKSWSEVYQDVCVVAEKWKISDIDFTHQKCLCNY